MVMSRTTKRLHVVPSLTPLVVFVVIYEYLHYLHVAAVVDYYFFVLYSTYTVVEAEDGRAALEWLETNEPAAVITDLTMPHLDGFGLISALRAQPRLSGVPVLVLTTESDPDKKARARAAGATGWIVKPFDPEKLNTVLRRVVH